VEVKHNQVYESNSSKKYKDAGLMDPRMGIIHRREICTTCSGDQISCPGHFGDIELEIPVFHPGFFDLVLKILRCICYNCAKPLVNKVLFISLKLTP
jgi:DNA-directed RNA polymerase beta' subunit